MPDALGVYWQRLVEAWWEELRPHAMPLRLAFFALLVGLVLLCQRRRPWTQRATLGVLCTIALFHVNFALVPLLSLLGDGFAAALAPLPRLPASVWDGLPAWALALLALVLFDFANYWSHRLLHTAALWPVHAVHHSEPDPNGLSPFRIHALESLVMVCTYVVLLRWLGLPEGARAPVLGALVLHGMYVHADLDWGHGPLRLALASPRFHRWHHADVPEARGKNFANLIPLFDWLFGTYYCPGPCDAPMGAEGVPGNDPLKLTLWPLVAWLRLLRRREQPQRISIASP